MKPLSKWVLRAFPHETVKLFGFLVSEFGFLGPEISPTTVGFFRYPLTIEVQLDPRDKMVETVIRLSTPDTLAAGLSQLVIAADLASKFRPLPWAAQSGQSMTKSLTLQAEALRDVLPRISGPDGLLLLREAQSVST